VKTEQSERMNLQREKTSGLRTCTHNMKDVPIEWIAKMGNKKYPGHKIQLNDSCKKNSEKCNVGYLSLNFLSLQIMSRMNV
jgi:hypothetical protein